MSPRHVGLLVRPLRRVVHVCVCVCGAGAHTSAREMKSRRLARTRRLDEVERKSHGRRPSQGRVDLPAVQQELHPHPRVSCSQRKHEYTARLWRWFEGAACAASRRPSLPPTPSWGTGTLAVRCHGGLCVRTGVPHHPLEPQPHGSTRSTCPSHKHRQTQLNSRVDFSLGLPSSPAAAALRRCRFLRGWRLVRTTEPRARTAERPTHAPLGTP